MNKDKQICGCITCERAKDKAIEMAMTLATREDMCPVAILTLGALLQHFAQEQISQQVLFVHFTKNGGLTKKALDDAGPHFGSVMQGIASQTEEILHGLVTDAGMIKAAFAAQNKDVPEGFPLEKYIAGMQSAAKADPVAEILAMLLNGASKRH